MIQNFLINFKNTLFETINKLKGSDRRIALAMTAEAIGKGGQSAVAKEFHVGRDTIRKGMSEYKTGIPIQDKFHLRGRKKAEVKLPKLLQDIKEIVDGESQIDPSFKTTRLFTRLTVNEIKNNLFKKAIQKKNYLPTRR